MRGKPYSLPDGLKYLFKSYTLLAYLQRIHIFSKKMVKIWSKTAVYVWEMDGLYCKVILTSSCSFHL